MTQRLERYTLKPRMTKDGRKTDNYDLYDGDSQYYNVYAIATFHSQRLAEKVLLLLNSEIKTE